MNTIRKVRIGDAKDICDIYNYYVENTIITFETELITEAEMAKRIGALAQEFPYFVVEVEGRVVGYCYLHDWHTRSAYVTSKEITIYLHRDFTKKGLGVSLYNHLFQEIASSNIHSLIACISLPNEPSVKFHESLGFKQVSHLREIGRKFDQWQDVGHWQLIFH